MFKKSVKKLKKSNFSVSICLFVLAAICVSCLTVGGVAFANDEVTESVFTVPEDASLIISVTNKNTPLKNSIVRIDVSDDSMEKYLEDGEDNFEIVQIGIAVNILDMNRPDKYVSVRYFKDGFTSGETKYDVKYGFICTEAAESLVPYGSQKLCEYGEIDGETAYLWNMTRASDGYFYLRATSDVYNLIYPIGVILGCSIKYFYSDSLNASPVSDFTKTLVKTVPYEVGENLKGKTATIGLDIFAQLDDVKNWLKEDGRKAGDVFKVVFFEGNDEDYIGFKAETDSDGALDYDISFSGIFEDLKTTFESDEAFQVAMHQGKVSYAFPSDKDFIIEKNDYYSLSESFISERSAKWLTPVKGTDENFFYISTEKYSDVDALMKAFPNGIRPTISYAVTFEANVLSSDGEFDCVIKIQLEDGYFYLPLNNKAMEDALYSEEAAVGSKMVSSATINDKTYFYGLELSGLSYKSDDEGYLEAVVYDAYLNFFDDVTVFGMEGRNAAMITVKCGDDVKSDAYIIGSSVDTSFVPEKEGFDFVGLVDEEGNLFDGIAAKDVVLTPKYVEKILKVTFDTDEPYTEDVKYGEKVSKPEDPVAPEGYEFGGWYKDYKHKEAFDFDEPIIEDVTIYPEFIKVRIESENNMNAEIKAFGEKCNNWFVENWKIFTPCAAAGLALIIFAIVLGVKAKRNR